MGSECRIHYSITDAGGQSPNVVQPKAQVLYMVRAKLMKEAMELQARVKAVLRRTERRGDRVLTWGDVELDPAAREVHKAGKPVELTYKEFELLKLLFSRRGVALTRDEILQAVWDYDYTGETRTVDMHVKALRQKLGEDIITTVRGVGYKMV